MRFGCVTSLGNINGQIIPVDDASSHLSYAILLDVCGVNKVLVEAFFGFMVHQFSSPFSHCVFLYLVFVITCCLSRDLVPLVLSFMTDDADLALRGFGGFGRCMYASLCFAACGRL